jgi:maltose/moltooligosaccharide transporter
MLPWFLTTWFHVQNTAAAGQIPESVRLSFYLGAVVFFSAVAWTVFTSKEYSPEEMAAFEENRARESHVAARRTAEEYAVNGARQARLGTTLLVVGVAFSIALAVGHFYEVMILSVGIAVAGILLIAGGTLQRGGRTDNGFVTILNDFLDMPSTMKQLAWAQFFSWFALFAMWIYTTAAVTSHIYGTNDTTSALYNDGANWVGVCFAVYNGVAALAAFAIPPLAKWSSPKRAHVICLICGAIGLISISFVTAPNALLGSMVGVGIAWASILSMPYAILTGSLPPSKLGYYMGVFNFFIVIPQIVAAAVLGSIIKLPWFHGDAIFAIQIGGASLLLAAALMLRVKEE